MFISGVRLTPPTIKKLDPATLGLFPWGTPLFVVILTIQRAKLISLGSKASVKPLLLSLINIKLKLLNWVLSLLTVIRPTEVLL